MDLRKLSLRQFLGAWMLTAFLLLWLVPLALGNDGKVDETFWFLIVLCASLLAPTRLTWLLMALWGLFFGGLAVALALGVPVTGVHEWGREVGAVAFGVAGLALVASAVVARRNAQPRS